MKLIKKINNNFVLGLDSSGETIIIEGKGLGFQKMPCELKDYNLVKRTYYDYDEKYIDLIDSIPQEILDVSNQIYEYFFSKVNCKVNPNLPFILADHISFSIQRFQKNINVNMPMYYDLMHLYPLEYETSEYALKLIKQKLKLTFPPNEKTGIILNLINAEADQDKMKKENILEDMIEHIIGIIENNMRIKVSKDSINFSRFRTHMEYMFKRIRDNNPISTENKKMYSILCEQYPDTNKCVIKINTYLSELNINLSDEEKLYLILHVNRLCNRELGL